MSPSEAAPQLATGFLPPAEPRKIETRSELLRALEEACELEHALMVQYLFAAFSIRTRPGEGIDEREAEYGRRWKRRILRVAREEMMHLGLAANLLAAVGGRAWMRRTNLPAAQRYFRYRDRYLLFTLRPLSKTTVERFICFEQPEEPPAVEEYSPEYRTVGELYRKIEQFIERTDPAQLFVGSPQRQEADDWKNPWFRLEPITDASSAIRAITRIVEEGEGTPSGTPESHYGRFVQIREELARVRLDAVVKPVGPNPYLRRERPLGDDATRIDDPAARSLAELFNRLYYSMLLLLELLYQFPAALAPTRGDLRDQIRRLMSGLLRPIGEVLTDLPAGDGLRRAGPTFEIEEFIRLSDEPHSALAVVMSGSSRTRRKPMICLPGRWPGAPSSRGTSSSSPAGSGCSETAWRDAATSLLRLVSDPAGEGPGSVRRSRWRERADRRTRHRATARPGHPVPTRSVSATRRAAGGRRRGRGLGFRATSLRPPARRVKRGPTRRPGLRGQERARGG
jgi:hypothetical protein